MNIRSTLVFAFVIILALSSVIRAGDFSSLSFIGFSKDGRYLAFEEYGTQDGSGYPYATVYFIETQKNTFAAPPVKVMIEKEDGLESTARNRAAALAAKKLKQFAIIRGNTGRQVVSHLLTDQTFDDGSDNKKANLVKFAEQMWSMHREGDYELLLTPVKINPKDCEAYGYDTFMMELKLTNNAIDNGTGILQKDKTLPAGRGCVLSYRIQDVYLYNDLIAVFISFDTPGFEGPDLRYMAVGGKFK